MNRLHSLTLALLPSIAILIGIAAVGSACATTKTPGEQTDDALVKARVGHRLWLDPDVPRFKIDIDVDEGVVTLNGVVDDRSVVEEAERLTRETNGVEGVVNKLKVEFCETVPAGAGETVPAAAGDFGVRETVGTDSANNER